MPLRVALPPPRASQSALPCALPCALAVAALLAGQPARAEGTSVLDWFAVLAPDRVLTLALQTGIAALRSQAEVRYEGLSVDLAAGTVALTGLSVRPIHLPPDRAGCSLGAERLVVAGLGLQPRDSLRFEAEVIGARLSALCLAPETRGTLQMIGLDDLRFDRGSLRLDYDFPSAAAGVQLGLVAAGLLAVDASARLDYLAFGTGRRREPEPYVRFRDAEVTVEDLGLLALMRPLMPPALAVPEATGAMLAGELRRNLERENARASGHGRIPPSSDPVPPEAARLSPAQEVFVGTLADETARFLRDGGGVTLALSAPGDAAVLLDFPAMERDGREAFAALNPRFQPAPARRAAIVPTALVARAVATPGGLSAEERAQAGRAFLTGIGAPRDIDRGAALLAPLAAGDPALAAELARALAGRDPAAAYRHALAAGAARLPGALGLLDAIEAALDPAQMLALQAEAAAGSEAEGEAPFASVAALRAAALARLSGLGAPRDYARAWFWASLAAAAGDAGSAALRDEIEARFAARGPEGAAALAAATAPHAAVLLREWIARDLPGRFGVP